jgi:hypothetical protein
MTNPFKKHSSGLFANHGSNIDQAMTYSMSLIDTLHGAFDEVPAAAPAGPSPERLALIDLIRGEIENWASEELEGKMTDWAQSELDLDAAVENWADSNMEDKIRETINDMEATVSFR